MAVPDSAKHAEGRAMTTEENQGEDEKSAQDKNWEQARNKIERLEAENKQLKQVASKGLAASVGLDPSLPVTQAATEQFLGSVEEVEDLEVESFQSFVTDDFGLNPEAVAAKEEVADDEEEDQGKANEKQMDDFQRGADKLREESQQPEGAGEEGEPDVFTPDNVDNYINNQFQDLMAPEQA